MTVQPIQLNDAVPLDEIPRLLTLVGESITVVLKGEPGIGKSSVLKTLETMQGDAYDYIYVDCPVKDVGDTAMSVPDNDKTKLVQLVTDLFMLDSPKPKVIMLDEFMKTSKLLQTMWTRLMLERCVGDKRLPAGSIVFATSNHTSDGVGDSMLAHAGNRVMIVNVDKPRHVAWNLWASKHGISSVLRAWVAMNPRCLASYLDGGQDDNEFIFNPTRRGVMSFVSPRSLAKVDVVVKNHIKLGRSLTRAGLAGTCGAAFANSFEAYLMLEKELVSVGTIIKDPLNVTIPEKPAALFLTMFNAVDTIETQDDLSAFMEYVNRIKSEEVQECFFTMALQGRISKLASRNAQMKEWGVKNLELMLP